MANILGLNFGHDGAAALIKDDRLVSAIANERISRVKKAEGVTPEMIDYVLSAGGLTISDLNYVAFSSYFYNSEESFIKFFELDGKPVARDLIHLYGGKTFQEFVIQIGQHRIPAILVQHHIAHAASSYYTSPFDRAACFSLDASGIHPEYCSVFAYGWENQLYYISCPGLMIGNIYSVFTEKLGVGPGLTKAGSTMALAAFGQRLPCSDNWRYYGKSFYERLSQPNDWVFINSSWAEFSGLAPHQQFKKQESDSKKAMDIAASLQYVFEESVLDYIDKLFEQTKSFSGGNLCLAGGSFLNSDLNMQIKLRSKFENIHLFPACGDDGTAVGAAFYVCHTLLNAPLDKYQPKDFMYCGKQYATPHLGHNYQPESVAQALSEGKVVAWYQGASEFGPRALGNRSILADPRKAEMKDYLNAKIKFREWYRPFAPSVLSEYMQDWFQIDFESKLMLFIAKAKKPEQTPAIVHVDNTARLQSVEKGDNPSYYQLIKAFYEITGVPLLLNTSLNINNEPLVETPDDALRLFDSSEIDILVLNAERMLVKE